MLSTETVWLKRWQGDGPKTDLASHLFLWQMMAHVPNHNTHHRSELAAMFATMDVPHPEDETVQYFLIKSGQRQEQG
jgi:hypothetical protein